MTDQRGVLTEVERPAHWDHRYRTGGDRAVSWFEERPRLSLALVEMLGARDGRSVVDVGGGASRLAGELVADGVGDVTVVDVSRAALDAARNGMDDPGAVTWVESDILEWEPRRRWDVWHDRAVFHFLTEPTERAAYRDLVRRSVEPGGGLVVVTFAEDGPESCSGLPVHRYSPADLLAEVAPTFSELASGHAFHTTPSGSTQHLTFVVAVDEGDADTAGGRETVDPRG